MFRKNKMDPLRINNYNKFLITLDKSEVIKPEVINENLINYPKSIGKTDQIRIILEKIIDKINNNYDKNGHNSSNFTGQTKNDILSIDMDIDDPNEYKEKEKEKETLKRMIFKRLSKRTLILIQKLKLKQMINLYLLLK